MPPISHLFVERLIGTIRREYASSNACGPRGENDDQSEYPLVVGSSR
jgi:hypothetical protein